MVLALFFSSLGALFLFLSSISKTKKETFVCQIFDTVFNTIANLLFKGYSGVITNLISLIRNILVFKNCINKWIQIILIILLFIIGSITNNRGLIGYFPIIASIEYTLIACRVKSTIKLVKISLFINVILWGIYDLVIGAYPMLIIDIITSIGCIKTLYNMRKNNINK